MISSERIRDEAEYQRSKLMADAEKERMAAAVRATREAKAMFWMYLAELLAAAGAVIVLRG